MDDKLYVAPIGTPPPTGNDEVEKPWADITPAEMMEAQARGLVAGIKTSAGNREYRRWAARQKRRREKKRGQQ